MVRFKNRYILFEIITENQLKNAPKIDSKAVYDGIIDSIRENFGDNGVSKVKSSTNVKYYNPNTFIGIVRVARDYIKILWGSLILMTRIKNDIIRLRVLDCKATIKKIEESFKDKLTPWLHNILKNNKELEEMIKLKKIEMLKKNLTEIQNLEI